MLQCEVHGLRELLPLASVRVFLDLLDRVRILDVETVTEDDKRSKERRSRKDLKKDRSHNTRRLARR